MKPEHELKLLQSYERELNEFLDWDIFMNRVREKSHVKFDILWKQYEREANQKLVKYARQIDRMRESYHSSSKNHLDYHEAKLHYFYGQFNFVKYLYDSVTKKTSSIIKKLAINPNRRKQDAITEFRNSIEIFDNIEARFGIVRIYVIDYYVAKDQSKTTRVDYKIRMELERAIVELDEIIEKFGDDEEIYLRARREKDKLEIVL